MYETSGYMQLVHIYICMRVYVTIYICMYMVIPFMFC